jgi:hypothetical protein
MGPARQPHGPNNGAAHADRIQTSAAAALPPLVSRSPAAIHAAICQPPPVAIKGVHPSPLEQPFPPPPLVAATTPSCLPSLSCRKPPPWSPFEPPNTTPSSAPTPGAPSTPLSAPLAAPLRHHRRSLPLGLCRHGNPCTDEPLPPQTPQIGPSRHLLPLATATPPHHRLPSESSGAVGTARHGAQLPCFGIRPKGSVGRAGKAVAKWAWPIPTILLLLFGINSKFNSPFAL